MHLNYQLVAALMAADEVARKLGAVTEAVHIKKRLETPGVYMVGPVKPPRLNEGDAWRRTGKRKGRRAP